MTAGTAQATLQTVETVLEQDQNDEVFGHTTRGIISKTAVKCEIYKKMLTRTTVCCSDIYSCSLHLELQGESFRTVVLSWLILLQLYDHLDDESLINIDLTLFYGSCLCFSS